MKKILYILGDKNDCHSGIYKYSNEIIKILNPKIIKEIYLPDKNILIKYITKFIVLPIYLILYSKKFEKIIFYEEGYAYLVLFSNCKKNIVIVHDVRFKYLGEKTFLEIIKNFYLKLNFNFLKYFNKIIAVSNETKKNISRYNNDLQNKIKIIHNIIKKPKVTKFNKTNLKKKYKIDNNKIVLLNVSSSETRKNSELLLGKINKLSKNFHVIKVGKLKNESSKNNKKITLINWVSEDMLNKLYKASDIYLDTSTFEGFGRTKVEAQINRTPVMCLNTKINREILGNSAVFYEKKNFEEKIFFTLKNKNFYKKKGYKNSKKFLSEKNKKVVLESFN